MSGMIRMWLYILLVFCSLNVYCQDQEPKDSISCITVGVLQGGGSLVGFDMEKLLSKDFGFQAGFGFLGFGAGLNLHFKPTVRSSFVSFQYWHQGLGSKFIQSLVGPSYVYRGKKWFTFQLGLGFVLEKGVDLPPALSHTSTMLIYSMGAYFPW